jgi:hypothetical protein
VRRLIWRVIAVREDRITLQLALVDAIAGENRLRRQALEEEARADRWSGRVAFAEARGLSDLAAGASARRERHLKMARLLRRRAAELQLEVQRLRRDVGPNRESGPAPPPVDDREARGGELALEQDLNRLRRRRATAIPSDA